MSSVSPCSDLAAYALCTCCPAHRGNLLSIAFNIVFGNEGQVGAGASGAVFRHRRDVDRPLLQQAAGSAAARLSRHPCDGAARHPSVRYQFLRGLNLLIGAGTLFAPLMRGIGLGGPPHRQHGPPWRLLLWPGDSGSAGAAHDERSQNVPATAAGDLRRRCPGSLSIWVLDREDRRAVALSSGYVSELCANLRTIASSSLRSLSPRLEL